MRDQGVEKAVLEAVGRTLVDQCQKVRGRRIGWAQQASLLAGDGDTDSIIEGHLAKLLGIHQHVERGVLQGQHRLQALALGRGIDGHPDAVLGDEVVGQHLRPGGRRAPRGAGEHIFLVAHRFDGKAVHRDDAHLLDAFR